MTVINFKNPIDPNIPPKELEFKTRLDDKSKKNARKSRSKRERYAAWISMGEMCPIYGCAIDLWECHIDHIIPLAVGGVDDWENLIMVHNQINLGKGKNKYPEEVRERLLTIARKKKSKILAYLNDSNFVVPKEVANKFDLEKVEAEELMADIGATANWSLSDTKYLITEYLKRGIDYIYKIAETIGKTIASCRSKLANLQIYNNQFQGQE